MPYVLLVDDDERFRASIALFLTKKGYEVLECGDGTEACRALHHSGIKFDFVITDTNMPRGTGIDVLQEIFWYEFKIPCLLHSAENWFRGKDLAEVVKDFPQTVFRNKGDRVLAYIQEFLDQSAP